MPTTPRGLSCHVAWKLEELEQKYEKVPVKVQKIKLLANSPMRAMCNWEGMLKPPLSPWLLQKELPIHYVPSKFNLYDKNDDPVKYIYHF